MKMMNKGRLCVFLCAAFSAVSSAGQTVIPSEEYEVASRHAEELSVRVRISSEDAYANYCREYRVPKSKRGSMLGVIRNRELRKAVYDYIYPDSPGQRVAAKWEIDSVYRDSVNAILIPYNPSLSGENISRVLYLSDACGIDSAQYFYLMSRALDMSRRIRRNPRMNVWNDEINILRKTLTSDQLDKYFAHKNGVRIGRRIRETWQRLETAGMTAELDSARECTQAYLYYFEEFKIKDLYRYYGTSQKKYLTNLGRRMPKMVLMADALSKKERAARRLERERKKGIGKEIDW